MAVAKRSFLDRRSQTEFGNEASRPPPGILWMPDVDSLRERPGNFLTFCRLWSIRSAC